MKSNEAGVLARSNMYFASPSPVAKDLLYFPISAGHFYCEVPYNVKRSSFDSLLVMHVVEGQLDFIVDNKLFSAGKGETAIINCFGEHEYYTNKTLQSVWLHFDGPNCLEIYKNIIQNEGNIIRSTNPDIIRRQINTVYESLKNDLPYFEMDVSLEIYKLVTALWHPKKAGIEFTDHQELADLAKKYISDNLQSSFKVEDVAKELHISVSYFHRVFKEQTGFTPYDYILTARLNKSKDLLQKTNLTIKEIAFKTGFNSESNFVYFFKKNTGSSPKRFRKLEF